MTPCTRWAEFMLALNAIGLLCWCVALPLRAWQMVRLEEAVREFRRQTRTVMDTYLPGAEVLKHLDSDKKE